MTHLAIVASVLTMAAIAGERSLYDIDGDNEITEESYYEENHDASFRYMIIVRPQDPHLSLFSATVIVASVWLVSVIIFTTTISVIVWYLDIMVKTMTILSRRP